MNKCKNCETTHGSDAVFCPYCGKRLAEEVLVEVPYIGVHINTGIYRLTFEPVEAEFSCEDSAEEAARHSSWGEDGEFSKVKIEKVNSTATPKTHPFICASCNDCVATSPDGRCEQCGKTNWTPRDN